MAQVEPRLVMPVGHTGRISSAVFSLDGELALTASDDFTARIYDVATGKELQILRGHTSWILKAVFSPDSNLVLTASGDYTSRIYEVATGREFQILRGHTSWINSAVFSPDGNLALTASNDSTARIYEVETGRELQILRGHTGWISTAAFSPDGKLALTASEDSTARIYEVATGKELLILRGHTSWISTAVFSPDGNLALTASNDSTARIYEVATGRELQILHRHTSWINSAVFSPDGMLTLTASEDSTARIYEVATGKELQILSGHKEGVWSAEFSPDGKLALTVSRDSTARIYEVATGKELQILRVHKDLIRSAVFSSDGKLALTASNDCTARIYEVATGKELQILGGHTSWINSAVFSPDGKLALTACEDSTARIYEVATGKELQILRGHKDSIQSAVFSPDGKLALTASWDSTARIYEVATGKELQILRGHTSWISTAVFSPDGNLVLTASGDNNSHIYEVATGKELQILRGHKDWIRSAVFSSDGKRALTAGLDSTARIYEVATGKELQVLRGYTRWILTAVFSPDGNLALTGHASTARIYEVATGKELQILRGHKDLIRSAVFSADGKLALTASWDSTACIYEVATGKELQILSGHKEGVFSAEFSPDGKLVLTASNDATARVYDVATGKELYILDGHKTGIYSKVFSPDGKYILTSGDDHKTILWDVATGKPLYTRLQLKNNDWLVYDEHYRFDGSEGAIDYLYLTCGLEVIDLAQVKDSLWVPGLVEKIMNGDSIYINDRPAPKLKDLNICDLTPLIEPVEKGDKGFYRYKITPRKGGLGETEVYINGNLTYSFLPSQLEKQSENAKDIYYLTFSADSVQPFLVGEKSDVNPVLVKSKVKGSGIYGRGVVLDVPKQTDEEQPNFYGVFIGVNDYGNPDKAASDYRYRNLDFAAKDANDLAKAVEGTARNLFEDSCHIYRLTGEGDQAPTKENMERVLHEIGQKAKASDVLYIFFAGHGDIKNDEKGQEQIRFILHKADKRNLYSSSFGVEDLTEWCHPKNIKAQKRVFVFDACHSGQIINQTMAFNGRGDEDATRIRQLDKLKDKNGMMILAAAAEDESAYEDETLNQGVLTYHLLQAMKEAQDTSLVIREWFDAAIEGVKEYSRANGQKQEPNSFGDGRFEIGNITTALRDSINIGCPKIRIGRCSFTDPTGGVESVFPHINDQLNAYFAQSSTGRGADWVVSGDFEKSFRVEGSYLLKGKKIQMRYKIFQGSASKGQPVVLPAQKFASEKVLVEALSKSILSEVEKVARQNSQCKKVSR
jgi:WD40 repeat protein